MNTQESFKALQSSDFGRYIGSLDHLFCAGLELAHIIGMILLLSSIALISLRLLGVGLRNQTLAQLTQATSRFIWVGLGLLVVSGSLIFIPAATSYYPNDFFWNKLLLLGLALLIHLTLFRKVTRAETPHPLIARLTGVLSLTLWFSVAFAGRFIGFF